MFIKIVSVMICKFKKLPPVVFENIEELKILAPRLHISKN